MTGIQTVNARQQGDCTEYDVPLQFNRILLKLPYLEHAPLSITRTIDNYAAVRLSSPDIQT